MKERKLTRKRIFIGSVVWVIAIISIFIMVFSKENVDYVVLKEFKDGCNIAVQTDSDDMEAVAEKLQSDYKGKCDSMFIQVGESVDDSKVNGLKEQIKIALTNKGKVQTGLDKIGYKLSWD